MYDHNVLADDQKWLTPNVKEIVDHHEDLSATNYPPGQLEFKDIRLAGSATSLLVEYFYSDNELL